MIRHTVRRKKRDATCRWDSECYGRLSPIIVDRAGNSDSDGGDRVEKELTIRISQMTNERNGESNTSDDVVDSAIDT